MVQVLRYVVTTDARAHKMVARGISRTQRRRQRQRQRQPPRQHVKQNGKEEQKDQVQESAFGAKALQVGIHVLLGRATSDHPL